MIEKAEEYIWANARVLEQRRFELLFKGGDAAAGHRRALEPYKTPDGGYGYALEPDGRGPTSQPPHIWTALEALEDAGTTDADVCDHLADDHRARRRRAGRAPRRWSRVPHAPWWRIGTEGTPARHRAAVRAARPPRRRPPVAGDGPRRFCWGAVDAIEKTHPVRGRGRDHVPRRRARPRPRRAGAPERLGDARARAGPRRHAARGLLARARSTTRTTSPRRPDSLAARVVHRRRDRAPASTTSRPSSSRTAAGGSRGRCGRPRSRSNGAGW